MAAARIQQSARAGAEKGLRFVHVWSQFFRNRMWRFNHYKTRKIVQYRVAVRLKERCAIFRSTATISQYLSTLT